MDYIYYSDPGVTGLKYKVRANGDIYFISNITGRGQRRSSLHSIEKAREMLQNPQCADATRKIALALIEAYDKVYGKKHAVDVF